MLKSTFQHLKNIGKIRESQLWSSGIYTWDDLERETNIQLSFFRDNDDYLKQSKEAFVKEDISFFFRHLNSQEYYRIAYSFPKKTAFLDIETTGLSKYYDDITVIGISIEKEYYVYIKGQDVTEISKILSTAQLIVTFNGSIFDLPFIRAKFPQLNMPLAHIDLRFLAKRVDLSGGQKKIEKQIGIKRENFLSGLAGEAAPLLWHKYCRGDSDSLRTLIAYNHADIEGMKVILDEVVSRLMNKNVIPKMVQADYRFSKHASVLKWSKDKKSKGCIEIPPYQGEYKSLISFSDLSVIEDLSGFRVIGLDISGSEKKASGWCLLTGNHARTQKIKTDHEIIEATLKSDPDLIAIDSPLSLPEGRLTVDDLDPGRNTYGIMRECERILKKRGVNVYPCLIQSMQGLTSRGMRLANFFRSKGIPVIESYPGAAQDIMRIPRKQASLKFLAEGLSDFGIEGEFIDDPVSHDELDAITSAVVGIFFWSGKFEGLGNEEEEYLIIPEINTNTNPWHARKIIGLSGAIASGKTTIGEQLKDCGFSYTRYSLTLKKMLEEKGQETSRENLQAIGMEINQGIGQRWLSKKVVQGMTSNKNFVIDGLRFPEDHAFLVEKFGPSFMHIHIETPLEIRLKRYLERGGTRGDFIEADSRFTENKVSELASLAHMTVTNTKGVRSLSSKIHKAVNYISTKKA